MKSRVVLMGLVVGGLLTVSTGCERLPAGSTVATLEAAEIAEYCAAEEVYFDDAMGFVETVALCVLDVAFEALAEGEDLVAYCQANFQACVDAGGPDDPVDDFDAGLEYTCGLELNDRTGCTATLGEVRSCERANADVVAQTIGAFDCADIEEWLAGNIIGEPELPSECESLAEECPRLLGVSSGQAPDTGGWGNHVEYYLGAEREKERLRQDLLREIGDAQVRVETALAGLEDAEITNALIAAAERGVRVRVVADALHEGEPEFQRLVSHADIDVTFGNGELEYLPDPTLSPLLTFWYDDPSGDFFTCTRSSGSTGPPNTPNVMQRPASYNVMSHTFFIIDATYTWNITAPMSDDQGLWLGFRVMSEEITRSYEREFRQMHGGVFATTLSVYNGPLKSITHTLPGRMTNEGLLRIRFNPQERLVKNVIDEIYRARSSVFLMTENLQNRDLINALRYKAENGFEVRVLMGQSQGQTGLDLLNEIDDLEWEIASPSMGRLPTFVVFDAEQARNGESPPRLVQVLSHELWRSAPFEVISNLPDDLVRIYPSDTFADGVLWELVESGTIRTPAVEDFVRNWEAMWEAAQ